MGKLKYMGLCPVNLANLIKQKHRISRLNGLEIEFKDQKYQVLNVYKKQGDHKSRDKLFFKLLNMQANANEGQTQLNSQMIKVAGGALDNNVNQFRNNLAQQGFKNVLTDCKETATATIQLEEYPCKVYINYFTYEVNIQATENHPVMKKVSEIVKKSFKLI